MEFKDGFNAYFDIMPFCGGFWFASFIVILAAITIFGLIMFFRTYAHRIKTKTTTSDDNLIAGFMGLFVVIIIIYYIVN